MELKRNAYKKLLDWKNSSLRKPLLLVGARQTGKTYLLRTFAEKEYQTYYYFNFEEEPQLKEIFRRDLNPRRIIRDLSILRGEKILARDSIIIFDEIQSDNNALFSLKYFYEQIPEYHIACAGSLLGVALSQPKPFPIGKVKIINLFPLNFTEFLMALGKDAYIELLRETPIMPIIDVFHQELIRLFKEYLIVGGMPEVVKVYIEEGDFYKAQELQKEILNGYLLDFSKYAKGSFITKLMEIWNSIPAQLSKENKRFIFSAIKKSARAREYEAALQWLEKSGLILRSYLVKVPRIPLRSYASSDAFKVYFLDVGLLSAMVELPPKILLEGNILFKEFKGALVENYVAQQLVSLGKSLFYWKGKTSEIDFLLQYGNFTLPMEVKAGINPKSKSLRAYAEKFPPPLLLRSSLLNLKKDGNVLNIPLYALNFVDELLKKAFLV